jgi:transcriptional regulator
MHLSSHFNEPRVAVLHTLMRAQPFATVVTARPHGPDADHVPLLLDDSPGGCGVLRGHVARANPVWREVEDGADVLAIFHGPHAYVSPRWYPSKREHGRVVPTWNYLVVHARGPVRWQHDAEWLRDTIAAQADVYEGDREDAWKLSDAPLGYTERLLAGVVGFEIPIHALSGKWKLSQNRSAADRAGVLAGLAADAGPEAAGLLAWMRER